MIKTVLKYSCCNYDECYSSYDMAHGNNCPRWNNRLSGRKYIENENVTEVALCNTIEEAYRSKSIIKKKIP